MLTSRKHTSPNPLEVVAHSFVLVLLREVDLLVDGLEIEPVRLLVLLLENFKFGGLTQHLGLVDTDQHKHFLLFLVFDQLEPVSRRLIEILRETYLNLLSVTILKHHDEIPVLNSLFGFGRKFTLH